MPVTITAAVNRKPSPAYLAIKAFLDKAPVDILYSGQELLDAIGVSSGDTIARAQRYFDLSAYREGGTRGVVVFWGNPKAIASLRAAKQQKESVPRRGR